MRRRWLAALVAAAPAATAVADDVRPAVRIVQVRAEEDATARAQMPDAAMPPGAISVLPPPAPYASTPPAYAVPQHYPVSPVQMQSPRIDGGTVGVDGSGTAPVPQSVPLAVYPDAPLLAPGSPYLMPSSNSSLNKWWFNAEYLYWWTKAPSMPTLLTTSPPASNGILGQPGTQVLLGDGSFGQTGHSGGRFNLGYWFGNNQCWGIDVGYFFIAENGESYTADSALFPVIARPFNNLNQNIPFSQIVASPGLAAGNASVALQNSLYGIDWNFRKRLSCGRPCFRLEGLIGMRYLNFDESLTITENFARTPNSPPSIGVPNAIGGTVVDQFSTDNDFYGVQLGLQSEWRRGRWFINSFAKVALGEMHQNLTIAGSQSILLTGGAASTANGGLLALPGANIGSYSQEKFAVVPEVGINLGYHFTPRLRAFVGYNFLYLSSVLRPADQIDTGLDVTRIPNFPVPGTTPLATPRPAVPFTTSSFYAQGINFGLSFTW